MAKRGCLLESLGAWTLGAVFFVLGGWILARAPGSSRPLFEVLLGLLLLHTSLLVFVGRSESRAFKALALSWVVFLVAFLVVSAVVLR